MLACCGEEQSLSMRAAAKGDAYEGLLDKSAQDTDSNAPFYTSRPLSKPGGWLTYVTMNFSDFRIGKQ